MTDGNPSNVESPYKSVSEQLYDEIKQNIYEGKHEKGERLPSERRLAEDNLVSRGTVREALRLLEQNGLVIRKRGSGSYINFPQSKNETKSEIGWGRQIRSYVMQPYTMVIVYLSSVLMAKRI